jgi:hypothetical protein
MRPVREILLWDCPKCDGKNRTAIPTAPEHEYSCKHCQQASGLDSLAGTSWQLARSADCPDCSGTSVVLVDYVRACGLCQWSDAELAYKPGTMVLFVPRQAKNNPHHSSVESGVIVKRAIRLDCVFVCYKLTKKTDLYLHRWASPEWAQDFLKSREET